MDIVDAHHHVWRVEDMPWLSGPMVPRIFGPYEPIKRDYLVDEYIADARSGGITQSVYVQANWPLDQVVAEVRWLAELNERTGWPTAVVGCADLFSPDAVEVMKQQAEYPVVRGTRLQLHWHENEEFRFASAPDRMKEPVFRRNVAALEELGWLFELQVFPGQMADAAKLVEAVPDVPFVLVHAGMLTDREEATVREWRDGMARLAQLPNLVVKLTGQGTFTRCLDPEFIAFVATETLGWFGPDRCMFGTNFPVEKLWTELPPLVDAWLRAVPEADHEAVFAGTARRVYALPE
ncbi:amidohydrolase family protein [Actinophytocola oryzae]|uniref:Putative TIM-barrel fold metal-dependent hydrolase n=1 Tax=Actinophytocola oryzae TaxID=502181 RepID=A0A4R7VXS6_9PSEU|nr:amidohydrolase family protein [Actinophytocola oryzae]TDV54950.1 putative TIM-barrel fold metal-dependent hydrolase [Actinophytocola oryzae]